MLSEGAAGPPAGVLAPRRDPQAAMDTTALMTSSATAGTAAGKRAAPAAKRKRASKARPAREAFAAGAEGDRAYAAKLALWQARRDANRTAVQRTRQKNAAKLTATVGALAAAEAENARLRKAVAEAEAVLARRAAAAAEAEAEAAFDAEIASIFGDSEMAAAFSAALA